jgi:hypothetical protein
MSHVVSIIGIRDAALRAAADIRAGQAWPINPFGEGTDAGHVWAELVEELLGREVEQGIA